MKPSINNINKGNFCVTIPTFSSLISLAIPDPGRFRLAAGDGPFFLTTFLGVAPPLLGGEVLTGEGLADETSLPTAASSDITGSLPEVLADPAAENKYHRT